MAVTDSSGRIIVFSIIFLIFIFLSIAVYFLAGILLVFGKKLIKENDEHKNLSNFFGIAGVLCFIFGILMFYLHLLPFFEFLIN